MARLDAWRIAGSYTVVEVTPEGKVFYEDGSDIDLANLDDKLELWEELEADILGIVHRLREIKENA